MTPPLKTDYTIGFYVENWVQRDQDRFGIIRPFHKRYKKLRLGSNFSWTVLRRRLRPCRREPIGLLLLPAWAATVADVWMADRHNITGQPDDEILHELVLVVLQHCTCDVMVPQGSSASR